MVTLAAPTQTLTLTRTIHAPLEQVYNAFTERDVIATWLADGVENHKAEGGHLLLTWDGGRYAFGTYTALEKDARTGFNLLQNGHETQVEAVMKSQGDNTQLTVTLSGLNGDSDAVREEWENRLETLQLALENGADLRITGRVILGIYPSDFNEEIAKKLGIPTEYGVRVGDVIPNYSAGAAGIQSDDVIVGVNGQSLTETVTLGSLVRGKRPGDTVEVSFYRDGQQHTIPVTLKGYPLPEAVSSFEELANRLEQTYADQDGQLAELFGQYSEAQAAKSPAANEWSANQVMAHLIMSERWEHNYLGSMMENPEANGWSNNHVSRINAVTTVYPTSADLLAELKRAHAETVAIVRNIPAELGVRKNLLWRMNFQIDGMAIHARQHINQIRAALEAA